MGDSWVVVDGVVGEEAGNWRSWGWINILGGGRVTYRLYMSETMSISASACAIFCSEEICGRPPMPKKAMLWGWCGAQISESFEKYVSIGLRVAVGWCVAYSGVARAGVRNW